MSATSANNTEISYKVGTATAFTKIPYLMEVPELGGAPEKIDVTVLTDTVKKFIPGIVDMGDLVFKFLYDNSTDTSNYPVLRGLQRDKTIGTFQIKYPDHTAHEFDAYVSVKMDAGTINGALTFSCTMAMQSDIEVAKLIEGA